MNDAKYKFWNPDADSKIVILDDPATHDFWLKAPQSIDEVEQPSTISKMAHNIACGNLQWQR